MTAYENGSMPILGDSDGAIIRVGNGVHENVKKMANIRGMVCDKGRNELFRAILSDVAICPNAKYNLFSVTKMLRNGWRLSGDKNAIF